MNKKIIIGIVAAALALTLGYLLFGAKDKKKSTSSSQEESNDTVNRSTNDTISPFGDTTSHWEEALSPFQGTEKKGYLELIEDLKTGRVNFVWEVWALRRKCPADYTALQCDETIYKFIDTKFASPDKEKMKELFKAYFQYEDEARKMEFPANITFQERYEILKNRRREIVGQEKADLFFGMEESQVAFMQASKNFMDSTKNLSGSERVKKYEELRKNTYGSYLNAVNGREDSFDHYKTEISLREKDLAGLSPEEREKQLTSLQVKYFGKEGAERIAAANKEIAAHDKKIADYEKAEREFLSSNNGISDKDKEQKLRELRVKYLGQEDAEAYTRAKVFEEEAAKIK
ncbi:MAG TPA: lipase secretion chaperone [Leptospiraceae bacterium]|nr:lipase secretion chaperone [Leptospiraceae bacterium]HMW04392.1 lipase secretion chaperone [Leptospiraceae bacterium]HMX31038.1 lipase secretion chaperone [Leptospiraceae bacterium]HMY34132.1 lipase secretion chaperone [Leptospiraceae bacterium]HMZ63843.1 lipase secretion chaperone [Leptospiraceae bacterium]